jgi:pilus assembly protein CpaB
VKQKNLILLVVAVGCGLLAAFLTSQMSAKTVTVEQAEMIVAAKDLNVGQVLEKDKLAELVKRKKMNKADIPLNAVVSEDELVGKKLTRGLRADDYLSVSDTIAAKQIDPPSGKHLYTIKLPFEAIGPWVTAGREVDVVCTHKPPGTQVVRHIKLLPRLLVMAVDVDDKPNVTGSGRQVLNTVTLAGNLEESHWLQLAQDAGAQLRMLVRGPDSESFTKLPDDELYAIFNKPELTKDDIEKQRKEAKAPAEDAKTTAVAAVKYPVTVSAVKAGTVIDDEFIDKMMQSRPFAGPAPGDVIYDLTAHKGKVMLQDVPAGAYLNLAVLGEKPKSVEPDAAPKVEPKVERKPVEKWDTTLTTGRGIKKYRFERYEKDGEWVFKGEVHDDGSVTPAPPNGNQPRPEAPKAEGDAGKIS